MTSISLSKELMQRFEVEIKKYNKPGYAVFDWDNTCVVNDVTEVLFYYFINNWLFNFNNENIESIIYKKIEGDKKVNSCSNYTFKQLGTEIVNIYNELLTNVQENRSLENNKFYEFRTKLIYMYQQLNERQGNKVAYLWVCNLFTGYSDSELYDLTIQAIEEELNMELHDEEYSYDVTDTDEIKVEKVVVKRGFRIKGDFIELFNLLRKYDFNIYVCSASFEPIVKAVATHNKFEYCVNQENIYGMKLKKNLKGIYIPEYEENYPLAVCEGKVEIIMNYIYPKYETSPFIIAGDSDGDYNMITDFEESNLLLLINGNKKSKIYSLFKDKVVQYPNQYFIVEE